jgi:acetyl-CoA acetyltransferase
VAVVAGDAVSSMPTDEFLKRADAGCLNPDGSSRSPVIPNGYDRIAEWQISTGSVTREQLAMVSVLMSRQAKNHPYALGGKSKSHYSLSDVLTAKPIGNVTSILECARRADGGAAIILASTRFMKEHNLSLLRAPVVLSGGEASGPLYPPNIIDEEMFSCEEAVSRAYESSQLGVSDIDFFGLYDCFPICFVRAIEAVGLAKKGEGGAWVERMYKRSEENKGVLTPKEFPVNTHGGLLSFGAPWETPAMYNIIEAVAQLNGQAGVRQVPDCKRALVYGNGGIFSASAVAVLGKGHYN